MIVLKATQDKVLAVLQSVAGIVERRHTLPILANVLIKKTGKSLPTGWYPRLTISSGVLPTTSQSRSEPFSPNRASRTAPPTK